MRWFVGVLVLACSSQGCQTHLASDKALGAVEIRNEQLKAPWPAARPTIIYVCDFSLDAANFKENQGIGDRLPGQRLQRLEQHLPLSMANSDPGQQVEKIVAEMSQNLIKSLKDKGFMAERLANPNNSLLPRAGWLLQGVFTEVDEGNRLKRATIGFGQGATQMEVQIAVSDLASANPREPFIVFGTVKDPKKMPGAIVSMNPYVAAAKFVMEKNATEKDIKKTAEQIVEEMLKNFASASKPR